VNTVSSEDAKSGRQNLDGDLLVTRKKLLVIGVDLEVDMPAS